MSRAIDDMLRETVFITRVRNLMCIMKTLKLTAQEAMQVLEIPESESEQYLAAIQSELGKQEQQTPQL